MVGGHLGHLESGGPGSAGPRSAALSAPSGMLERASPPTVSRALLVCLFSRRRTEPKYMSFRNLVHLGMP